MKIDSMTRWNRSARGKVCKKRWAKLNADKLRASHRKHNCSEQGRTRREKWQRERMDRHVASNLKWRRKNRLKVSCHNAVARALAAGKIKKKNCEVCGSSETEAHHDDYAKPLVVRWFCVRHHNDHHLKISGA